MYKRFWLKDQILFMDCQRHIAFLSARKYTTWVWCMPYIQFWLGTLVVLWRGFVYFLPIGIPLLKTDMQKDCPWTEMSSVFVLLVCTCSHSLLSYGFFPLRPHILVLDKHQGGISSLAQGRPPEEAGGSCEQRVIETQKRKLFGK